MPAWRCANEGVPELDLAKSDPQRLPTDGVRSRSAALLCKYVTVSIANWCMVTQRLHRPPTLPLPWQQVKEDMAATPDPHANRPAIQGGLPMAAVVANGGATMQQMQQQPMPAPVTAPVTAAAIAALQRGQAAPRPALQQQPPPGYGFAPPQLAMLKHQIIAFRSLKVWQHWHSVTVMMSIDMLWCFTWRHSLLGLWILRLVCSLGQLALQSGKEIPADTLAALNGVAAPAQQLRPVSAPPPSPQPRPVAAPPRPAPVQLTPQQQAQAQARRPAWRTIRSA